MAFPVGQRPTSARRRQSPAARVGRFALAALLGVLVAGGVAFGVMAYVGRNNADGWTGSFRHGVLETLAPASLLFQADTRCNIILIGEDVAIDNRQRVLKEDARSDTNIVISLDSTTNSLYAISLPRDLRVTIPGQPGSGHKLNAAHRVGGPESVMATVGANLGIRIDHYVKTNARGFVQLVDKVGGVDLEVERDMEYDDTWQNLHIDLKKGFQHLDGKQAEGYVRWRKSNNGDFDPKGDLGRIERQQKVLKLLAAKMLTPSQLLHLPSTLEAVRGYVQTSLTDRQLGALLSFMQSVAPERIVAETLPCDYRRGFMYLRREEAVAQLTPGLGHTFDPTAILGGPLSATLERPSDSGNPARRDSLQPALPTGGLGDSDRIFEIDPGADDLPVEAPPPRRQSSEEFSPSAPPTDNAIESRPERARRNEPSAQPEPTPEALPVEPEPEARPLEPRPEPASRPEPPPPVEPPPASNEQSQPVPE